MFCSLQDNQHFSATIDHVEIKGANCATLPALTLAREWLRLMMSRSEVHVLPAVRFQRLVVKGFIDF
jgi:hypothetical protein